MNWIHKKLNSKSGISLAIALVFFLLCAMVGTVVLSAASVSAGNTARERQLYRETLALTSAANALSQDIQNMTFTGAYKRTETVTTTAPANAETGNTTVQTQVTTEVVEDASAPKLEHSALFKLNATADDLNLSAIYKENYRIQNKPDDPTALPWTPAPPKKITFGPVAEKNIPQVTGTVEVAQDYTITVELSSGENTLTMTFSPNVAVKAENTVTKTKSDDGLVSEKTTVTTYTTTLTWGQPTIQEGGTIHEETP